MKKFSIIAVAALITVSAVSTSHAIVGAGFHWGFDFSLSMDDVPREDVFQISESSGGGFVSISRGGFERSAINFGGKVYVDFIPILPIDAVELSMNFGVWQYDSELYVHGNTFLPDVNPINLGVKQNGEKYFGLSGTPYAKMHFDLTLRKQLLNLLVAKFDAGVGYSLHLATPIVDADFIKGVYGDNAADLLLPTTDEKEIGRKVVNALLDETLGSSVHGMHIMLGVKAKLPVIPIGLYLDGKYMIPFSKDISDAKKGVNGFGLLINTGISLSI